ncbi:MAG: hypothetical protein ACOY3E_11155 [Pseudomonadota bacterium]
MINGIDALQWSGKARRWPLTIHVLVLSLLGAVAIASIYQGSGVGFVIPTAILIWLVSLYLLLTKAAIRVDGQQVHFVVSPWYGFQQSLQKARISRLERRVIDGQIIRYVAVLDDGQEVLLPPAPWLHERQAVIELDAFMKHQFPGLLSTPQAAA